MAAVKLVVEVEEIVPTEKGVEEAAEGCVRIDGSNGRPAEENDATKKTSSKTIGNAPEGNDNNGNPEGNDTVECSRQSQGPQESPCSGPQCLAPRGSQGPSADQRTSTTCRRSDHLDRTSQNKKKRQVDRSPEVADRKQARRAGNKKRNSVKTHRRSPASSSSSSSTSGRRTRRPLLTVALLRRVRSGGRETDTKTQLLTASLSPSPHQLESRGSQLSQILENRQRISLAKERRAARTMGVVMGAFVVCWLPFFLMYVVFPFCPSCQERTDKRIQNFVVWLGYINSTLNPIIYTIFNIDFRRAFKSLLQGNCHVTS